MLCLLMAVVAGSSRGAGLDFPARMPADLVKVRLVLDSDGPSAAATPDAPNSCEGVTFSRNLKYRDNDQNVLDVAAGDFKDSTTRPVLLFVAGENFAGENGIPDFAGAMQDAAMCFAARNGMVGVNMTYRLAPQFVWPAGSEDTGSVVRWVAANIASRGGDPSRIFLAGHSAGAVHVANYVAHPQFHGPGGVGLAGVILISGLYDLTMTEASNAERQQYHLDAEHLHAMTAVAPRQPKQAPDQHPVGGCGRSVRIGLARSGHEGRTLSAHGAPALNILPASSWRHLEIRAAKAGSRNLPDGWCATFPTLAWAFSPG